MASVDYVNDYEQWHKRIVEAYKAIISNPNLKDAIAQAHPIIWEDSAGDNLKLRMIDARQSLETRVKSIGRKKEGRYERRIFLQDIYALCTVAKQTPNYYLLPEHPDENDDSLQMQDSHETLRLLLKYVSRNRNMDAFITHYYGKLSDFDCLDISTPSDPIFMIAFKSEILNTASSVFQVSDQDSVDEQIRKAEGKHDIDYYFALHISSEERTVYRDLICAAFPTSEMSVDKIFDYKFLDDDQFFDYSWNDTVFEYLDLERWTQKKRFELSLYSYLLTCVLAAIVDLQQFYYGYWGDFFAKECKEYILNNTAVRELIKKLFLGSFLRINDSIIISSYGEKKPGNKKDANKQSFPNYGNENEHKHQKKQKGSLADKMNISQQKI